MISMKLKLSLVSFILIWGLENAFAQAENASSKPNFVKVKERRATLNFEDELVEGTAQKPELFYLFQKKNFNYKRLIKLRENFLPEMRKTTEDIQRVRSNH